MGRPVVALEWADPAGGEPWRGVWTQAVRRIVAHTPDEVWAALREVERWARQGHWCVGAVAYEAASAFDPAFTTHASPEPLLWFMVLGAPDADALGESVSTGCDDHSAVHAVWPEVTAADRSRFNADHAAIQEAIARGDVYQVNHTTQVSGRLVAGDALAYFKSLRRAQPGGYVAYIDLGDRHLVSVSPELFFDCVDGRVLCRPMKGTAQRGDTPQEDNERAQALLASAKERAENVMIVDLIRNDLSRVAKPFSVRVPRLFHLEPLPSVWQMTSDVSADLRDGLGWVDVLAALFPCGSVVGAPKHQAMAVIHERESTPRGVYCGAMGVVRPGGAARFSVAIRTVQVEVDRLVYGVGSGITSDASADGEWREWQHKRKVLLDATPPFALLETLGLRDGVWGHDQDHWSRLTEAASFFGWVWGDEQMRRLREQTQALALTHPAGAWRVRCVVHHGGDAELQAFPLEPNPARVRLALAPEPFVHAHSPWVRHKTTRRTHYEQASVSSPGVFDTVLYNPAGEITECTRGNIAACLDGRWVTPPLRCGLLPGVGRLQALRSGRLTEGVVRLEDVSRVSAWAFINSLRGWIDADLL